MSHESKLDRDLAALKAVSARDVPDLKTTIDAARRRGLYPGREPWKLRREIMALIHSVRTRPAVAAVVLGVLVVLVAMVVPVSYERVAGQDVALTLTGNGIGAEEVRSVAGDLKSLVGGGSVAVEAVAEVGAPHYVLRATSPKRGAADMRKAAADFAGALASKGYSASVQVAPHRERVTSPAMAYALDQIIRISVDGKVASQLEAEIKSRLAEAGVPDAQVSVTDHPGGGRDVKLRVEREHVGDPGTAPAEPMPQLVLTKDGAPLGEGNGFSVRIQKKKINGATTLALEVTSEGKSAKVEVPNADTMSDAALTDAISSQLRQAGIEARVTVVAGKVEVEPAK